MATLALATALIPKMIATSFRIGVPAIKGLGSSAIGVGKVAFPLIAGVVRGIGNMSKRGRARREIRRNIPVSKKMQSDSSEISNKRMEPMEYSQSFKRIKN